MPLGSEIAIDLRSQLYQPDIYSLHIKESITTYRSCFKQKPDKKKPVEGQNVHIPVCSRTQAVAADRSPSGVFVCVLLTQINCNLYWSREAMKEIGLCNYLSEGSLFGRTHSISSSNLQSTGVKVYMCALGDIV